MQDREYSGAWQFAGSTDSKPTDPRKEPHDVLTGERIDSLWENFRAHPVEQCCHFATGAIASGLALFLGLWVNPALAVAPMGLSALVCVRQLGEFSKRRDTIGHDMFWHVTGYVAGLAGVMAAWVL